MAHHRGEPGGVEDERGAVESERRLGALVVVGGLVAEAVAAAAGREVVEGPLESVAAEEPVEGALGAQAVLGVAGDRERRELGLDERRGVERLLVARPGSRLVAVAAAVAGQP